MIDETMLEAEPRPAIGTENLRQAIQLSGAGVLHRRFEMSKLRSCFGGELFPGSTRRWGCLAGSDNHYRHVFIQRCPVKRYLPCGRL